MTFTITVYAHGLDEGAEPTWTVALEEDGRLLASWNGNNLPGHLTAASLRLRTEDTARRKGYTPAETEVMRQRIANSLGPADYVSPGVPDLKMKSGDE